MLQGKVSNDTHTETRVYNAKGLQCERKNHNSRQRTTRQRMLLWAMMAKSYVANSDGCASLGQRNLEESRMQQQQQQSLRYGAYHVTWQIANTIFESQP